jgi:CO/xanthine dehydrogenase FAD-binding subunit
MIVEYHRPDTIDEALRLLQREVPRTSPMGGGTVLNRPSPDPLVVVDLQSLGLSRIEPHGHSLQVGATATLQPLLDTPGLQPALVRAIRHEATYNLRQSATLAGTLVSADGRSPLAAALLVLDVQLELAGPGGKREKIGLGDLLPLRGELLQGRLITSLTIPLNIRLAYEYVARTPADLSIVCAAAARWPAGRTRLVLGGFGASPLLTLDGPESAGAEQAARDAYSQAEDEWASAEYRQEMAVVLARRCLQELADS